MYCSSMGVADSEHNSDDQEKLIMKKEQEFYAIPIEQSFIFFGNDYDFSTNEKHGEISLSTKSLIRDG